MKNIIPLAIVVTIVSLLLTQQYKTNYSNKFNAQISSVNSQYDALECLTENIYFEATGEPIEGMMGVAIVTLNRVKSNKFPDTVCKVVHQKHQFSWTSEKPKALVNVNKVAWDNARLVAKKVLLEGEHLTSIENALYYHTTEVNPVWNRNMKMVKKLGNHLFFEE